MRLLTLVHLAPDASPRRAEELEAVLMGLPQEVPSLRRVHLGRHLPGSVGGGDYTWDALVEGRDVSAVLQAPAVRRLVETGVVASLDPVAFEPQHVGIGEPDLAGGIKRTLLFSVLRETPAEVVERFERDLLGMPDHIGSIRNWALSRTDLQAAPTPWTHVWEQEYADVSGLEVDYMVHPYHWGFVDAWFDPECPQRIVELRFAHVYCPAPSSILGWK